jgi:hypothetical protein
VLSLKLARRGFPFVQRIDLISRVSLKGSQVQNSKFVVDFPAGRISMLIPVKWFSVQFQRKEESFNYSSQQLGQKQLSSFSASTASFKEQKVFPSSSLAVCPDSVTKKMQRIFSEVCPTEHFCPELP